MKKPKRLFRDRQRTGITQGEPGRYDPNDVRYIATHEAGHAVSAIVLGYPLKLVDIRQRRLPNGVVSVGFTDSGKVMVADIMGKGEEVALPRLIQELTGPHAEMMVNDGALDGCRGDLENARRIAAVAICNTSDLGKGQRGISPEEMKRNKPRLDALFKTANEAAMRLVKEHWPAIEKIAALLVERRELSGDEVAAIVNGF